jgi:hypothetical protein
MFETREAALKFFFDDRHLSMDILSLKSCLTYCHHLESLELIFRNSRKHYKGMSASARIGFGAETFFLTDHSAAVYMAKIGLSIPELAVVQFPKPVKGFALHHVAGVLTRAGSDFDDSMEGWIQLGVDIIQNGADLFSMRRSRTPLLTALVGFSFSGTLTPDIRRPLQRWNDMLRRANVDLEWYCAKESEIWKPLSAGLWKTRSDTCSTRLVKVKFCHETQSCIPVFQDEVIIPVMRLRLMPGSFRGSRDPFETICWDTLSKEEEEEGHWSEVGCVFIRSSLTCDYDPEQESFGWYSKLIDCTQDDNGTLLRMTRSSRNGNSSSKRASSQPPSQRRTRHDDQVLFSSRMHEWLPLYHYCHVQSTWTVSCHRVRRQHWLEPRMCVYQEDNRDTDRHSWLRETNFLDEIRACKSFRDRYDALPYPLLRHSHRTGCPQGCDQVDLEKLAKPRFLPAWHPCRNEL